MVDWTPARAEAQVRYNAKTFKKVNFALRLDEDADIIASWEKAKEQGATNREWLREVFDGSSGSDKIAAALRKYGVQQNIINSVLNEL